MNLPLNIGIFQQLPSLAPKLYSGLFVLIGFWIVAIIIDKLIRWLGARALIHNDILNLLARTSRIAMILLGLVTALGTIGLNISALVASLGLTGFALGFALKDALSNVLAGVLVLIYRPFKTGDRIQVTGYEGEVVGIDLRYTALRADDHEILIPNANLFSNPVVIFKGKSRGNK